MPRTLEIAMQTAISKRGVSVVARAQSVLAACRRALGSVIVHLQSSEAPAILG